MNSRQLQYVLLLSQVLNFSQVAEQLNISQPALSKQIMALEKELNVKLFDRSTMPLTLTPAGEKFVADAKELLFREEQLKRSMEDFKNQKIGRLEIGVSPFRCLHFMPSIIKKLREQFPDLQIVLHESNSAQLHKWAIDGSLDFVIMNLPVDEDLLDVVPLKPERLVLAVPENLKNLIPHNNKKNYDTLPIVDLSQCEKLPFITLSPQQELRQLFDKLCLTMGLRAEITTEVIGISSAWAMARAGVGATILPLQFIENNPADENLNYFIIDNESTVRHPAVVTRKGQHISKYAQCAIEILKNI